MSLKARAFGAAAVLTAFLGGALAAGWVWFLKAMLLVIVAVLINTVAWLVVITKEDLDP